MTADEWPSFSAELTRKTLAQVDLYTKGYDAAKITKREYFILISALYDATSGLLARDASDLLADIHAELRKPAK